MMEPAYTLELFDASRRDAFDAIFARMAPDIDPAVQARRRWWCFDNPRGGVFALFHDGEQIAATCYLASKTLAFGDRNDGGFAIGYEIGETATDPRHQRRGLFSKLVKASVAHAGESGRPLVYGTPNSQSTPGYAKLGFEIVESPRSWLFLLPSLRHAIGRLLRRRPKTVGAGGARGRSEIAADAYVAATVDYPRLNAGGRDYLAWRVAETPMGYRFAQIDTRSGRFECAIKVAPLGEHTVVVIAEYFLNGVRPPLGAVAGLLRRVVADLAPAPSALGIYVHGERPSGLALARLYAARVIPHRVLPICATGTQEGRGDAAWFGRFQLSDCDIG